MCVCVKILHGTYLKALGVNYLIFFSILTVTNFSGDGDDDHTLSSLRFETYYITKNFLHFYC